ncbi:hypothetical protein FACS189413_03140 [Bacteroidia bacterium]|nr:hypothetical protein FACS189413_03140 [Bacteroidia bacterium]
MTMKQSIKWMLQMISKILFFVFGIIHWKSKFHTQGIGLLKLNLSGSVSLKLNSGYIFMSRFIIKGTNNTLIFDDNVKISNCTFVIQGNNCRVDFRGANYMKKSRFELLSSNTKLIVMNNTGFNRDRIVIAGINNEVRIGLDCFLGENVEIWASDGHAILNKQTNQRINRNAPVLIGDRVWLGSRTAVMKGVKIGNDVVVATGSIVTKDINNNELVAGIPAIPIKNDIVWCVKNCDCCDSSADCREYGSNRKASDIE